MSTLVTGIGRLVTNDPAHGGVGPLDPLPPRTRSGAGSGAGATDRLGVLTGAALVVEHGRVAWTGPASSAPAADEAVDLHGAAVLPGFVDSHTHALFAGDRADEFEARMLGEPYTGGGIARTVAATRAAGPDALRATLGRLCTEMLRQGTTTVEVKTGYGLDVPTEALLARVAREATDEVTFLGAHVVPPGADRREYLDLVVGPMLEAVRGDVRWVDVFCEPASPHAFDGDEAREVLLAGRAAGLGLRVHGNQLGPGPGAALAVELGAASVDHGTYLSDADVAALAGSGTVATLLPGVEYSTRSPYPDARRLLDAGCAVALATDCNPGTCFSSAMPWVVALAVRELRMSVAEAVWAATAGGARALRRDDVGHLAVGARAHLAVLDAPDERHLAYRPGVPIARGWVVGG